MGATDYRYNQILIEEFMDTDCGGVGLSFAVHNDICLPYLADLTTVAQKQPAGSSCRDSSVER